MENGDRGRFSIGKTFSEALAILGACWRAMLGATIILSIAIIVIYALFAWPMIQAMLTNPFTYAEELPIAAFGWAMLGWLAAMVIGVWLLVALLKITLDAETPHGMFASLTGALPKVLPAIGIAFCVFVTLIAFYIACAVLIAILTVIGVMIGEAAAAIMLIVGIILVFVALIYLMLGWVAAVPAMVAEDLGPVQSMARSWQLVRGHRLRLTALWVLSYIAVMIIVCAILLATMPGFSAVLSGDPAALEANPPSPAGLGVYLVFNILIGIFAQLFFASLFAATYRNLAGADSEPARGAATLP